MKIQNRMEAKENGVVSIEIINNTRGGIQSKIWERANGGQIQVPDVVNNENCTVHPNIELSEPYSRASGT